MAIILSTGMTNSLAFDFFQPAPQPEATAETLQPEEEAFDLGAGVGLGNGGGASGVMVGGYIDQAIVFNRARLRYDNVQGGNSDFAEFLYGGYGLNGNPSIQNYNYNEVSAYVEQMVSRRMSIFLEAPFREATFDDFTNAIAGGPGAPRRESGFSDMNAGVRYALIDDCCDYLTAQFKVYIPTGDPQQGLGTGHVSLQPGLLGQRTYDRLRIFSELHDWISTGDNVVGNGGVNGDPNTGKLYGGNVLRYGLGAGYDIARNGDRRVTLLGELVGWSVLQGYRSFGPGALGGGGGGILLPLTANAAGDTLVNFKAGARYNQGAHSLYVGWGFPLTSKEVYNSILRVEYTFLGW